MPHYDQNDPCQKTLCVYNVLLKPGTSVYLDRKAKIFKKISKDSFKLLKYGFYKKSHRQDATLTS